MFTRMKRRLEINKKVNMIALFVMSFFLLFLSFGYSVVQQNLMVAGDVEYNPDACVLSDSWSTIISNVQAGNTIQYSVGCRKDIEMDINNDGINETYTLRIANNSNPGVCEGQGYSTTSCGFVLEFVDVITQHEMHSTSVNGWPSSSMRAYLNSTIYNALPAVIKNAVIDTNVVSGYGSGGSSNYTSTDKLYLLSAVEVYGSAGYDTVTTSMTRQLDYYQIVGVTSSNSLKAVKKVYGIPQNWFLRSQDSQDSSAFLGVNTTGEWRNLAVTAIEGVSPAFRIDMPSFAADTWDDIIENIQSGDTHYYHVGDTKTVDLGSLGVHTLRIANKSTPEECEVMGFSETACGFVLEFEDIITTHNMNSTLTNVGGWPASEMREYVNDTIYNALPSALKDEILDTMVVSGHGTTSGELNFRSMDKLYLLSSIEVSGTSSSVDTLTTSVTRQLDYYFESGVTSSNAIGASKKLNGTASSWWLRSASASTTSTYGTERFNDIYIDGKTNYHAGATSTLGVSPAFRLGAPSFQNDSLDTLVSNVQSGDSTNYHVGDTKEVDLGSLGVHTLRIANLSTVDACFSVNYSQTACGFVLEFADIITTYNMNSTLTNVGGWPASEMRTYVNTDVYNALPTVLKNAVIDTTVVSGHGATEGEENFVSTDKVYLLDYTELVGTNHQYISLKNTQTRQLDYYSDKGVTTSNYEELIKKRNGTANTWWLRSASYYTVDSTGLERFRNVYSNGSPNYHTSATSALGVSPAFRLGVPSFENDSWETIIENANSGDTSMYHVGETKTVDLGSLGIHTLRIANNSAPSSCYQEGYSETACGFVIEFADIVTTRAMNTSSASNTGGWKSSSMRTYLNSTIYEALPTALKNAILNTRVLSGYESGKTENYYTIDKLYLLTYTEISGGNSSLDTIRTTMTRQLDYYKDAAHVTTSSYSGAIKKYNDTATAWWLRSARSDGKTSYYRTTAAGNGNATANANTVSGVSPAFRLGPMEDMLMKHSSGSTMTFGKSISRNSFESITFVNSKTVAANAIDSWDVSEHKNESVMAWYLDADNDSQYELYIGQDGGVKAHPNSEYLFYYFRNIDSINLTYLDVSNVEIMRYLFYYTGYNSTTFTLDLGNQFDTSNVLDMSNMFNNTGRSNTAFTLNLGSSFDTSKVKNMDYMFYETGRSSTVFTLNLGDKFDTSNVQSMDNLFSRAGYSSPVFTLNLGSKFDTSNVTNMGSMFSYAGYSSTVFTLNLGNQFDTSNVTDMRWMFLYTGYENTSFTLNLGNKFDTSKVTSMYWMFGDTGYKSTVFTLDLGDKFDTSNVTDMGSMFSDTGYSSPVFTLNLGNKFDTSNVKTMESMFDAVGRSSTVFTLNLGDKFDTSSVKNMHNMFLQTGYSNTSFTLDLGDKFDTSSVTNMGSMFNDTGYRSTIFTLDLGDKFDTSSVTNMSCMFQDVGYRSTNFTLNLGDKFDTSSVTNMGSMFSGTGRTSTVFTLDLGDYFDTSSVTDMSWMFASAGRSSTSFTLDLGDHFDTSSVTDMEDMFKETGYSNTGFALDLGSGFVFTNVTTYSDIFLNWRTTQTIYVKSTTEQNWIVNNAGNSNLTVNNVIVRAMLIQQGSDSSVTFGKSINRNSFESLTTVNHINVPANAIDSWDASANHSGAVMAWYTDTDNDSKYELYLGQIRGVIANTNSSYTFSYFNNLDSLDLTYFNTWTATNMSYMFYNIGYDSTVFTLDLGSNFDTSGVTKMSYMFAWAGYNSTAFTLNLGSHFDTSKVTTMNSMFSMVGYSSTGFTLNLGSLFDTSKVENMEAMFLQTGYTGTNFVLNLGSKFNTSKVKNMKQMFFRTGYNAPSFTLNLGNQFDTSSVENMHQMFYQTGYTSTSFTLNLGSHFDTSSVTDMNCMFYQAGFNSTSFALSLGSDFDTSNVTDMYGMFGYVGRKSTNFTLNLGTKFDTSNVTDMGSMFNYTGYDSTVFTLDLGDLFYTSKVTNMSNMFGSAGYMSSVFTLNLGSHFDTSIVTNMSYMFRDIDNRVNNLVLDLSTFDFGSVTTYTGIFTNIRTTTTVYVKDATARTWVINNGGNSNLTTTNVLIKP